MKKSLLITSLMPLSLLFGSTWTNNAGGDWGVSTNWTGGIPNALDAVADISSILPLSPFRTITLTSIAPTIGTLAYNGDWEIAGPNTLTFSSSSGTANMTIGNAVPTQVISSPILLNSNLLITPTTNAAIELIGVISGPGGINVQGTASSTILMILQDPNVFMGSLTIGTNVSLGCVAANTLSPFSTLNMQGGTIDFQNFPQVIGGLSGTSPVPLGNITLTVNTTGTSSYSGVISGTGSLTVGGVGILQLTGTNTYSGPTTINSAGTLQIDGALNPASIITVNPGGTLAGSGTVSIVQLSGAVTPGNTIGTQTIGTLTTSAITFNSGSTYNVQISDTSSDLINAFSAIIDGGTLSVLPSNFTNPGVTTYTVLTGSVTQNASFALVNPLTRYTVGVVYNPTSVQLTLSAPNPFPVIVPTGNAGAVAKCFDRMLSQSDLAEIIHILDLETPTQMARSFNEMSPSGLNNIAFTLENVAERIRQIYTNHFFDQQVVGCPSQEAWRLWVAPFIQRVKQHGKYVQEFSGFTTALDYSWAKHWAVAGGFTYASTDMDASHDDVKADYQTYAGTFGASWVDSQVDSGWFADSQLSYLYSPVSAKRKMKFAISHYALNSTVARTAKHHEHSNQLLTHIGFGYDFRWRSSVDNPVNVHPYTTINVQTASPHTFNLYPFVNIDYLYLPQDGYEEKGAQSLDLKVHRKKYDLLRPEGGVGFSYSGCFKNVQTLFDASLSYVHEFRFQGRKTTSSFKPISCQFTVKGPKPQNNLISPDIRLRITGPNSGFSLTLGYHGEYGKDFSLSAGQAEFRKAF
jgi:autotransporter-associated beta strand protein